MPGARRPVRRPPRRHRVLRRPRELAAEPPYDTVVALDGLARLSSVEVRSCSGRGLRSAARHAPARRQAAALGGELPRPAPVVGVAVRGSLNPGWVISRRARSTRPAGLARLRALYIGRRRPRPGSHVLRVPRAGRAHALLARRSWPTKGCAASGESTGQSLRAPRTGADKSPVRLAVSALRHGATARLAPAWIPVGPEPPGRNPALTRPKRHRLRCQMPSSSPFPSAFVCYDIRRDADGGWTRRPDGGSDVEAVPLGRTLLRIS